MRTITNDTTIHTIHDAKTRLSQYVSDARNGKRVYIGRFGRAEVMLVAVEPSKKPGDVSAALAKMDAYTQAHPSRPARSIDKIVARQREERDWPEPTNTGITQKNTHDTAGH